MSVQKQLREMLTRGETILAPGAYDPIIARVVELMGFNAVYMGGNMTGVHLVITEPMTSLTEQVEAARWVTRAVNIPLIVDADAGWGDPVHTMRCVREFEAAGASAIHIEDQVFPKRTSYHRGLEHMIPRDEFRVKMSYALQARRTPDFIIIGRTDGLVAVGGSMEEAIYRGNVLKEVGVDVVFPCGRLEPRELEAFRKGVPDIPLMSMAGFPLPYTAKQLEDLGYQVIIYPGVPQYAALDGVTRIYEELKEKGTTTMDPSRVEQLTGIIEQALHFPEYWDIERATTEKEFG